MKLSSSTLCGCCFCCYCHCWLMMLLMVSSVVHVSPEMSITTTTTNNIYTKLNNKNYAYQSEMTEFLQLNRKILNSRNRRTVATASTFFIMPKLSPSLPNPNPQPQPTPSITKTTTRTRTTYNRYQQNTVNSNPTFEHEAITTVATMQTKSTISSNKVATQAEAMTFIPAAEQLQITKQHKMYDTTDSNKAVKAKRKIREKSKIKEQEVVYNSLVEAAISRPSTTNNYVADKNYFVMPPPTMLSKRPTMKPFVHDATIRRTKKQANDYGNSNKKSKNKNPTKNTIYGNVTIDLKYNRKQKQQQQQHNGSIVSSNSKCQNSESSNEFKNISNNSNSSKQKTTKALSPNHTNNRCGTIGINTNGTSVKTTTTKILKQKQQDRFKTNLENEARTTKTETTAFDAATQLATAINSLPSNGTTDFSENSSHNLSNHNSNNKNNNFYNYIGTSIDSVSILSPKEINKFSNESYHLQKRKFIESTTSSSITSLQLRKPAAAASSYLTFHQYQQYNQLKRPVLLHRHGRQAVAEDEQNEKCRMFIEGDPEKNELYSPEYPNDYPKNINCTRVITAPKGQIIRLDFRNSFHIEEKEECKFDFLEIRDGQYGFSNQIGKYCGTDFPPEITSRERYLWMHFHSDESIEYSGFTAVYEFIDRNRDAPSTDLNCTIEKDGFEGFINATDVPTEIKDTVIRNKIPLDCMWRIQVQEKWKIQVKFVDFKLAKPNDCETNFLDIFPEQTVMPLRVKNFCGSAGEGITSDSNILHMRFYAEPSAINSTFSILYTAFRERGSSSCAEDEYDCEDATCIAADLKCNGRSNCKFLWDEEGCEEEDDGQSEHMIIIITVFGLILGGMVVTFLVNCIRKIMHDQKIIREHIRQSKESKLNEMGRNSKARSRENISIVSPRQKHSQTSLQILDDVSNRYYREMELQTKSNFKEKDPSILRHDMIVQTSLCSTDDSSTTITDQQQQPSTTPAGVNACDMGCQTRESLFATASLMRQKSKTPSLAGSQRTIEGVPPPPRFSTFGYDAAQIAPPPPPTVSTLSRRNMHLPQESLEMEQLPQQTAHTLMVMPHQQQQQQQLQHHPYQPQQQQHQHLHHRPSQEICHHHHQHQQHLQKQTLPRHHAQQQQYQQQQQPQHHQHMQHHHHTSSATIPTNVTQLSTPGTAVVTAVSTGTSGRHREQGNINAANKNKQTKVDESKVFVDIRNSAPDVIIMTSH